MIPIDFQGTNVIFNGDDMMSLPAHKSMDQYGITTTCWKMTWRERFAMFFNGVVWCQVMTFNKPMPPQKLTTENPCETLTASSV